MARPHELRRHGPDEADADGRPHGAALRQDRGRQVQVRGRGRQPRRQVRRHGHGRVSGGRLGPRVRARLHAERAGPAAGPGGGQAREGEPARVRGRRPRAVAAAAARLGAEAGRLGRVPARRRGGRGRRAEEGAARRRVRRGAGFGPAADLGGPLPAAGPGRQPADGLQVPLALGRAEAGPGPRRERAVHDPRAARGRRRRRLPAGRRGRAALPRRGHRPEGAAAAARRRPIGKIIVIKILNLFNPKESAASIMLLSIFSKADLNISEVYAPVFNAKAIIAHQ